MGAASDPGGGQGSQPVGQTVRSQKDAVRSSNGRGYGHGDGNSTILTLSRDLNQNTVGREGSENAEQLGTVLKE